MELHQLRYLVAVADSHSFTRASELCHVTQPTLSHQIKKLEEEVGEPLLQRRKKGAYLTPLGEHVYRHAQEISKNVESVQQAAGDTKHPANARRSRNRAEQTVEAAIARILALTVLPDGRQILGANDGREAFQRLGCLL